MLSCQILSVFFAVAMYCSHTFATNIQEEKASAYDQYSNSEDFVKVSPGFYNQEFSVTIIDKCRPGNFSECYLKYTTDNYMHSFDEDIFDNKWSEVSLILHLEYVEEIYFTYVFYTDVVVVVEIKNLPPIAYTVSSLYGCQLQFSSRNFIDFSTQQCWKWLAYSRFLEYPYQSLCVSKDCNYFARQPYRMIWLWDVDVNESSYSPSWSNIFINDCGSVPEFNETSYEEDFVRINISNKGWKYPGIIHFRYSGISDKKHWSDFPRLHNDEEDWSESRPINKIRLCDSYKLNKHFFCCVIIDGYLYESYDLNTYHYHERGPYESGVPFSYTGSSLYQFRWQFASEDSSNFQRQYYTIWPVFRDVLIKMFCEMNADHYKSLGICRRSFCKVFTERCSYESLPEIIIATTLLSDSNIQFTSLGLCGFFGQSDRIWLTYDGQLYLTGNMKITAADVETSKQRRHINADCKLFEEGGRRWCKLDHVLSFQLLQWISSYQGIILLFGFFWIISRKHKIDILVSNEHQNEALPIEYFKKGGLEHKDFRDNRLEKLKNENCKRIMEIDEKILSILRHLDVNMKTKERRRPHSSI